ncbi:MAG: response regulator, partial [Phycisphaerae bacterium]
LNSAEPIGLVIADIMMPDMDGLEFLKQVRQMSMRQPPPVIMCSGRSDRESVLRAIQIGAADFIVKPVDARVLARKVQRALQAEPSILADEAHTRARLDIDQQAYWQMARSLAEKVASALGQIQQLAAAGQFEQLALQAGSLAGAAQNLGAERLYEVVSAIEQASRQRNAAGLQNLLLRLRRELKNLNDRLEQHQPPATKEPASSRSD